MGYGARLLQVQDMDETDGQTLTDVVAGKLNVAKAALTVTNTTSPWAPRNRLTSVQSNRR